MVLCSSFFLSVEEAGFNDRDAKRGEGDMEEGRVNVLMAKLAKL